ncbi:hypothetical protein [Azospirillum sp. sgz302134]
MTRRKAAAALVWCLAMAWPAASSAAALSDGVVACYQNGVLIAFFPRVSELTRDVTPAGRRLYGLYQRHGFSPAQPFEVLLGQGSTCMVQSGDQPAFFGLSQPGGAARDGLFAQPR